MRKKFKRKSTQNTGALYIRNLPDDLKLMFKGTCARRGESMSLVIESLLRLYVDNPSGVKIIRNPEDWD